MNFFANLKGLLTRGIRIVRNAFIDLRFGGLLSGKIKSRNEHLGAKNIENTDYMAMSYIFGDRIKPTDVLVEVGCGKGRVINWWLDQGFSNRIIGLELDETIASKTRRRLRRYKNVSIITGDAIQNLPADGTIFYLYNPFFEHIWKDFKSRLLYLFSKHDDITVLYYNCKNVEIFQNDPRFSVEVLNIGDPSPAPFSPLAVIKIKA